MTYGFYIPRDLKTSFLTPHPDVNDASAIRNFEHAIMSTTDIMHTHPQDFQLYKVGTYDTDTGDLHLFENKELICEGKDFVDA